MNNSMDRFELYLDKGVVAIQDKLTDKKYSTIEDIIKLMNTVADKDYYYNRIINTIAIYENRIRLNKGVVLQGDIYNAKMSVLYDLIKEG